MGKKEGGKGGNHKGKQQLRLGGKKVAAGACIIVENYECRRPFAVFFFGLGNSDPHFLWVPGKAAQNLWNECKECIVWEPHRSVVNFISALASRSRGVGNEGTRSGENADASFSLSISLSL